MDSLAILQKLGTRRFIDELAETLSSVGNEVARTRRKGKVSIVFTLTPGADDGISLVVNEEIKPSWPVKPSRGAFFVALDGQLFEADPRQLTMNFTEVDRGTDEVRTVDAKTVVREA
jgi:hypothetical protein